MFFRRYRHLLSSSDVPIWNNACQLYHYTGMGNDDLAFSAFGLIFVTVMKEGF